MKFLFASYLGMDQQDELSAPELPLVEEVDSAILNKLGLVGVKSRILSENSNLLDISFVGARNSSKEDRAIQFGLLSEIADNIYKLDVNNSGLIAGDLAVIGQMKNLNFLRLERNQISDKGLEFLVDLARLEYLNVYGNPLTDNSIDAIKKLQSLKKIFLWQTEITKEGVKEIQSAFPNAAIIFEF